MSDQIKESINHIQSIVDFYKLDDENNYDYSDDVLISMKTLLDYITNLQNENKSLKEKLNCKEILKQGMPENTEFVILTKANYDRQQKDIELELIDYKSRVEKAVEWFDFTNEYIENEMCDWFECSKKEILDLYYILQGGKDE